MRQWILASLLLILLVAIYIQNKNQINYRLALALPHISQCSSQSSAEMQHLVDEMFKLGIPGGQISFANNEGTFVDCSFGWGGSDGKLSTVSDKDSFRYASLAKIFTSITAIKLAKQNIVILDKSLLSYLNLGITPNDNRIESITLKQLLQHRAGFNRYQSGDPMLEPNPWCPNHLSTLKHLTLDYTPGEQYSYSNLGYCLLGQALTQATNTPLEKLISKTLSFDITPSIAPTKNAGYASNEVSYFFDKPETDEQMLLFNYPAMLASGGWSGTAHDLTKLLQTHITSSEENFSVTDVGFESDCNISIWRNCHGLVFYKYQQPKRHLMYWRDGSLPGLTAFAAVTPSGSAIVILANYRRYNWLELNDALGQLVYDFLSSSN